MGAGVRALIGETSVTLYAYQRGGSRIVGVASTADTTNNLRECSDPHQPDSCSDHRIQYSLTIETDAKMCRSKMALLDTTI